MRVLNDRREVAESVGDELGVSEWVQVSQERIDLFADATGDRQWIHVDPERAARGPFGATIAHGYLTLSLLPFLGAQVYAFAGDHNTAMHWLICAVDRGLVNFPFLSEFDHFLEPLKRRTDFVALLERVHVEWKRATAA